MKKTRPEQSFLQEQIESLLGRPLAESRPEIENLAAIGFTDIAWRNSGTLEDIHADSESSLSDLWMMRANISTFRAALPFFTGRTSPDWDELHQVLEDPWRTIANRVSAGELLGDSFEAVADDVALQIETCRWVGEKEGNRYLQLYLGLRGGLFCKHWYGSPWWPNVVDALLGLADSPPPATDSFQDLLTANPEALDDEDLLWCLREGLRHRATSEGFLTWRESQSSH